jgi:hypothetical protein
MGKDAEVLLGIQTSTSEEEDQKVGRCHLWEFANIHR